MLVFLYARGFVWHSADAFWYSRKARLCMGSCLFVVRAVFLELHCSPGSSAIVTGCNLSKLHCSASAHCSEVLYKAEKVAHFSPAAFRRLWCRCVGLPCGANSGRGGARFGVRLVPNFCGRAAPFAAPPCADFLPQRCRFLGAKSCPDSGLKNCPSFL